MRENHVFFLYYFYFVFEPNAGKLFYGEVLLLLAKYLLLALNLTKGFSMEVNNVEYMYYYILICIFIESIYLYMNIFIYVILLYIRIE